MSDLQTSTKEHHPSIMIVIIGLILVGATIGITQPVTAVQEFSSGNNTVGDDSICLDCHNKPGLTKDLANGEVLLLTIDEQHFSESVHFNEGVSCTDCHQDISGFPHPEFAARSLRDASILLYTACQKCHTDEYNKTLDSVHQKQLAGGNTNAAICTDCHNPHTQKRLTDPVSGNLLPEARLLIPQTCARCHNAIYTAYKSSVHGAALSLLNDQNVPTCITCHGVHNIQDPTTNAFRTNSPQLCADCHTNPVIMNQYNISTEVVNTYVADFHGTTITLFEETNSDQPSNKPVCYDCHGVHDIKKTNDPVYGLAMKENLLVRCQTCHPDATDNFPGAWMSHYIPSPTEFPLVYYINLFYKFLIPTVLGGMGIYVLADFIHRMVVRIKGVPHK
ncbi:MAG: cytochrome c3 family protein [Chloroflexota bacterium]